MQELRFQQPPAKYWFGSDFHFGHNNIIDFMKRPYATIEEHDAGLVATWNKYVAPWDIVYVIGDFSFLRPERTTAILKQLNGQKNLVRGNHDHTKDLASQDGWNRVIHYHEQRMDSDRIILSHFPIMSWHQMHRGAYHLHGHSHGQMNYPGQLGQTRIMDVGVDNIAKLTGEYRPMEWTEIKELLSARLPRFHGDYQRP